MEQDDNNKKNIIWIDFDTNTDKCLASIQDALKKKPELVYVKMSPTLFPNRMMDLPKSFIQFVMSKPQVKMTWNSEFDLVDFDPKQHDYLDMTMISVFYDAGINELRKIATKKAVNCWMKQLHLPKEMMFIELGFNGVFTFSK